ncbi:restriction endonuclease subunit S [Blastococcus brunescens]|uniref:Restriction endonuclease subunit S n=1 Tax=Blastococcus brunescens TaxID=1564165 RepID=A0ABZ1AUF4_9ACTN|nr:restriction endonuclease subunit S [Blastococcus sp. BMG 8361]WRL62197.1 restriction endonuclease subunit S [Blastococcus sp. BMG 8361]
MSSLGVANSAAVVHPTGTVMFCRTASVGLLTITGRPMATTQAFVTWTAGPHVLPRYLLYVLAALRPELFRLAHGSTHLTIYMPDLEALRMPLPPSDEQRRIANFLDDQIERLDFAARLRRRQADLLEERSAGALDTLYDASHQERETVPLGRLLARPPCYGVLMPRFVSDGIPFCRINSLLDLERGSLPDIHIDPTQSLEYRRTVLSEGDVLTSVVGSLGLSAVVPAKAAGANIARAVARLQPGAGIDPWFIRGYLGTKRYLTAAARATGSGTAQATLNMGDIVRFPVTTPVSRSLTADIGREVRLLFEAEGCTRESMTRALTLIEERRRATITAAITGQIDVTTARAVA